MSALYSALYLKFEKFLIFSISKKNMFINTDNSMITIVAMTLRPGIQKKGLLEYFVILPVFVHDAVA